MRPSQQQPRQRNARPRAIVQAALVYAPRECEEGDEEEHGPVALKDGYGCRADGEEVEHGLDTRYRGKD